MANLITPEFRAGFVSVFKATAQKNEDGSTGAPKFSVRACFPPTTDISAIKAAASECVTAKWGNQPPKSLRNPFRRNDELDKPVAGLGDDWIIMTFSAPEDRRPGLVDGTLADIIDPAQVYAGAWYRAQINPYAYDKAGNKGVAFGLQNLQKLRDDDVIGSSNAPASKVFEPVASATTTKSAANIFG